MNHNEPRAAQGPVSRAGAFAYPVQRDDHEVIVVENDRLWVEVVPEFGGKIWSIRDRRRDYEWLWRNPVLPLRRPCGNGLYREEYDNGGLDECFPSVDQCRVTTGPLAGTEIPDHGVLWEKAWEVTRLVNGGGESGVELSVSADPLPVRISRTLLLRPGGNTVSLRYRAENLSGDPVPYLWAVHPLLELVPDMTIDLSADAEWELRPEGEDVWEHLFPVLKRGAHQRLAFPQVDGPTFKPWAIKAFVRQCAGEWVTLNHADGRSFAFRFAPGHFDGVAFWINAGFWHGAGSQPYFNIGFEPMIGLSDNLDQTLREDLLRGVFPPCATRDWELELRIE